VIPIRDHTPSRSFPIVTISIIALNVAVFIYQLLFAGDLDTFFYAHGLVPCLLTNQCTAQVPGAWPPWLTIFAAMFMHSGWLHIGGNMLYLWIFGNNVEDAMGPLGFAVFYLLCGVLASLAQVATAPASTVVNVGASGAIAGVLGAYLLLFPQARVDTLVFFGWFINLVALPAILVLGVWFVLQLFSGIMSVGPETASGGVAFFAHVGGFVAGLVLVNVFKRRGYTPSY
jgi:membrane associated rhomboid family serine protease